MPPAYGQAQWVEEVFANLVSNAIKYIGANNTQPVVMIDGRPVGRYVRFEVRDNGIGIRAEHQEKLFKMFARAGAPAGVDGLGLGLSIAHRIVRRLRGDIGVDSAYGEGSCFWFTLPATDPGLSQSGLLRKA
jgi:signal transduction histidine kinase